MTSIPKPSGLNIEGVKSLKYIDVADVADVYQPNTSQHTVIILLKAYKALSEIYFTKREASFTETPQTDASGIWYKQSLPFVVPKDSPDLAQIVKNLSGKRFIVVFTDNNEQIKVLGSLKAPCRLARSVQNPASGRNQHAFEFTAIADNTTFFLDPGQEIQNQGGEMKNDFSTDFKI